MPGLNVRVLAEMLNASNAFAGEPTLILGSMVTVTVPVMGSLSLQRFVARVVKSCKTRI